MALSTPPGFLPGVSKRWLATAGVAVLAALVVGVARTSPARAPEPVPEPEVFADPPPPLDPDLVEVQVRVRSGETFGEVMQAWGVDFRAVRAAALADYDLARIRPDRALTLVWRDGEAEPVEVRYALDEDRVVRVARDAEGWSSVLDEVAYTASTGVREVVLQHSLWVDGLAAGLRAGDLVRLAKIFEYELDFNTELREGARFVLAADVLSAEGKKDRLGAIHAVRLTNGSKTWESVRHVDTKGREAYYRPDGLGMRRPFLRSPLQFSNVTSGFNPKRFHPILKVSRPHNGTDFGAPTGTPVRAVASGRVTFAGTSGGHGRFVKLDHEGPWETSYSHLNRIRVKQGQQVEQGQIIGEVGSTGLATGPHLHYQMWKSGKYVDAMRVDLPFSSGVSPEEKRAFEAEVAKWLPMVKGAPSAPPVALSELPADADGLALDD